MESLTKQNSSNFSSAEEILNSNSTSSLKKENTNNFSKSVIENNYQQLLLLAKGGDNDIFLNVFNKILSLPKDLLDINYYDGKGFTALHYACNEGNLKIVEILLNAKCDPNIQNCEKEIPLHLASKKGYLDICKKLVENGASINTNNFDKNTPIHFACMNNDIELLKFFLTKLPNVDSKNIDGKMPIDLTNNKEIKELLESYIKNNENQDKQINTEITKLKKYKSKNSQNFEKRNKKFFESNNNNINNKTSISPVNKSTRNAITSKSPKNIITNKKNEFNPIPESFEIKLKKKNTFQENIPIKKSNSLKSFESNDNNNDLELNNSDNNKQNKKIHRIKTNILSEKNVLNYNLKNELDKNNKIIKKDILIKKQKNSLYFSTKINLDNEINNDIANDKFTSSKEICTTKLNKYNLNSCINRAQITNKSRINTSKNIDSINYGHNRINLSINVNNENKKTNNSLNKNRKLKKEFKGNKPPSIKQKYNETNHNTKHLLVNSFENLNNNEMKSKKGQNNKGIVETTEKLLSGNMKKGKKKIEKKYSKGKNLDNSLNNNCNLSKLSQGLNKKNLSLDSIDKTKILEKTVDGNSHKQSKLNPKTKEKISLSDFVCLAKLGKGSFGDVYLVEKKNTKQKYAMKVLRKDIILNNNLMKYAIVERNVLSLSNHPFIVKLDCAFQTSSKLFLVLEYCPNGDLSKHLLIEKRFSEKKAKFYLCEVLLALEDLHKRDIIFRDLKPDNVILDEEGHCKLTDFGLSREGISENQYAQSFCGSLAYLAPEMLKKQGHGKAVDWYLLGVLFYEMLVGVTPYFALKKEDIFNNIENAELKIPDYISKEAAELLRRLLERDPNKRLGGGIKDAQEIKEHPYFKDMDWDKIYKKEIKPPIFMDYMSKMIHFYHKPRIFTNEEFINSNSDKPDPNMLMGWSFTNNVKI